MIQRDKDKLKLLDLEIIRKYSGLLRSMENNNSLKEYLSTMSPKYCLSIIICLDLFSRHIYRRDSDKSKIIEDTLINKYGWETAPDSNNTWRIGDGTAAFTSPAGTDNIFNFSGGGTSGIGILRKTGSAVLKFQLDALETEGLGKTISNPKLFTLDNQVASITQGEQIAISGGEGADQLIDANLQLIVTPNIIGDGNVMLEIKVTNDTPNRTGASTGINKMEINTRLLVADGDIVVIGGIKKNQISNSKQGVPGAKNVPVVGKLLSCKNKSDTMSELLVFIAPRIL